MALPWHVGWYARFDMSDDRLEPSNFARGKSFATKAEAERYAKWAAPRALDGFVEISREDDGDGE